MTKYYSILYYTKIIVEKKNGMQNKNALIELAAIRKKNSSEEELIN
ncbi:hypothetical protein ACFO4N_06710 [Camelliibacillus cellulosilyticus]|uniref:Uncharacterized protein n=1 Tax=Camelliibacillus cellulosilyticus TaxID=2174486 RepID=A0ABV9GK92_9BACL